MNILNKGRCSRCIASKLDTVKTEKSGIRQWLKCLVFKNWCKYIAKNCKQPPMGIPSNEFTNPLRIK